MMGKPKIKRDDDDLGWIEGELLNSDRKYRWGGLYCSRNPTLLKGWLNHIRTLEEQGKLPKELQQYSDFRISLPKGSALLRCPKCRSKTIKKVRRGDQRLWKCVMCSHRWERTPKQGPEMPSEALRRPLEPRNGLSGRVPARNGAQRPQKRPLKTRKFRKS